MGLENVKEEILRDAKQRADAIIQEAEKEAAAMRAKAGEEIAAAEEKADLEMRKATAAEKKKAIAKASFDAKKKLQDTKKELIDEVFAQALESLKSMDETERKNVISSLLAKGSKQIDVHVVYCARHDKGLVSGYDVKEGNIAGGVIVENKEGTERVDYSFEALLSQIRDQKLGEIAEKLF